MAMSRRDAELFYDGRIPPGAVDDTLPSRFAARDVRTPANGVRVGRVTEKPEITRCRMARFIGACLVRGSLTREDLGVGGFTEAEIKAYANDALRQALIENPTLQTIEMAA